MRHALFHRLYHAIDSVNFILCRGVSWLTLAMVIITFLVVLLRYGFNIGFIAMQESVMYLHATVFMVGAANTLRVNEHVRVDVFYRKMNPKRQQLVDIAGGLVFLLPVNLFVFFMCFDYVRRSWQLYETSPEAGGLPFVFLLKSLLLVFATTMVLQGIAEITRNLLALTNREQR